VTVQRSPEGGKLWCFIISILEGTVEIVSDPQPGKLPPPGILYGICTYDHRIHRGKQALAHSQMRLAGNSLLQLGCDVPLPD